MNLRQKLVDVAVDEIRREVGPEEAHQNGTRVSVQSDFKMARVLEAVFRYLYNEYPDELEREVIAIISARSSDHEAHCDQAADAILAVFGHILRELDPMP